MSLGFFRVSKKITAWPGMDKILAPTRLELCKQSGSIPDLVFPPSLRGDLRGVSEKKQKKQKKQVKKKKKEGEKKKN